MFTAIFASLLGENKNTPPHGGNVHRVRRFLEARQQVEITQKSLLGTVADLIRDTHGISQVAGLDSEELRYLLGRDAELDRVDCADGGAFCSLPDSFELR